MFLFFYIFRFLDFQIKLQKMFILKNFLKYLKHFSSSLIINYSIFYLVFFLLNHKKALFIYIYKVAFLFQIIFWGWIIIILNSCDLYIVEFFLTQYMTRYLATKLSNLFLKKYSYKTSFYIMKLSNLQ